MRNNLHTFIVLFFILLIILNHYALSGKIRMHLSTVYHSGLFFLHKKSYYILLPLILFVLTLFNFSKYPYINALYSAFEFVIYSFCIRRIVISQNLPQIMILLISLSWISAVGIFVLSVVKILF